MADPVTLTMVGMAVSTAMSVGSQVVSGIQQSNAMKAQSDYNSKVYEMQAEQEREAAEFEAKQHVKDVQRIMAAQRARYAASGIDISAGGTPLEVAKQSAMAGELDKQAILYNGEVSAIRAKNQAALEKWSGRTQAGFTRTAGFIGAGTTALTGATQFGTLSLQNRRV